MRSKLAFLVAVSALSIYSIAATAQSIKQVEVSNFPVIQEVDGAVEVTNLPEVQDVNVVSGGATSCEVKRFQLVGYTVATTDGVMGGPWGANGMCQAEFPGSRMCVITEVTETAAPPPQRPPFAWSNTGGAGTGRGRFAIGETVYPCSAWTDLSAGNDGIIDLGVSVTDQGIGGNNQFCDAELPIACCALLP